MRNIIVELNGAELYRYPEGWSLGQQQGILGKDQVTTE